MSNQPALPREYSTQYDELLASLSRAQPQEIFGRDAEKNWEKVKFSAFWPQWGSAYRQEESLLVIGRAANGGDNEWLVSGLSEPSDRNDLLEKARKSELSFESWMTPDLQRDKGGYNRNNGFWRAVKSVVEGLSTGVDDWPKRLAWTNLYKISPACGGNPGPRLREFQRPYCINLLKMELAAFAPRHVLFVTDDWCQPFMRPLGFADDALAPRTKNNHILRTERRGTYKWVVTVRPDRLPKSSLFAEQVLKALEEDKSGK